MAVVAALPWRGEVMAPTQNDVAKVEGREMGPVEVLGHFEDVWWRQSLYEKK